MVPPLPSSLLSHPPLSPFLPLPLYSPLSLPLSPSSFLSPSSPSCHTCNRQISTSSIAGSLPYLPRTHYTENSTTFDLIVQNFPYRSANSRIILEMYIVSGPSLQAAGDVKKKHWIDDEYTPSVFETFTYPFGDSYLQWKPISYQSQSRQSTASQQANYLAYGGLQPSDQGELPRGLASAVFRPGANVTRFYMVIGTPGDGTYLSTAYFTW